MRGWVLANPVNDSMLFRAGADERMLAAVDPATGNYIWKKDMELLQFGPAVFDETMLYAGTTIGKLHGINIKTGNLSTSQTRSHQSKSVTSVSY